MEKIAEKIKVPPEFLVRNLASIQVLSPEWLVASLKANKAVPLEGYLVDVNVPKKLAASSKADEEEKKDRVVKLEDIMEDVYAVKFGKKRSHIDMEKESGLNKKAVTEAPTKIAPGSQMTHRSKSFKDGEEILSEDSYIFQWKPDYIAKNEKYWDSKAEKFACAKGSSGLAYKKEEEDAEMKEEEKKAPMNKQVVEQIEKLYKYYETQNDKGRMHGYRRALQALRGFDQPLYDADQLKGVPGIGDGIIRKVKELI